MTEECFSGNDNNIPGNDKNIGQYTQNNGRLGKVVPIIGTEKLISYEREHLLFET